MVKKIVMSNGWKQNEDNDNKRMSQASFSSSSVTVVTTGEQGCCHVSNGSDLTLSTIGSLWCLFCCSGAEWWCRVCVSVCEPNTNIQVSHTHTHVSLGCKTRAGTHASPVWTGSPPWCAGSQSCAQVDSPSSSSSEAPLQTACSQSDSWSVKPSWHKSRTPMKWFCLELVESTKRFNCY